MKKCLGLVFALLLFALPAHAQPGGGFFPGGGAGGTSICTIGAGINQAHPTGTCSSNPKDGEIVIFTDTTGKTNCGPTGGDDTEVTICQWDVGVGASWKWVAIAGLGSGINELSEDLSPELGADLSLAGFNITTTGGSVSAAELDILDDGLANADIPATLSAKTISTSTLSADNTYDFAASSLDAVTEIDNLIKAGGATGDRIMMGVDANLIVNRCLQLASDGTVESAAAACGVGGGIANLGVSGSPQSGTSQTLASVNDTNVTLGIGSATDTHTFTVGWAGTLADSRISTTLTHNAGTLNLPGITLTGMAEDEILVGTATPGIGDLTVTLKNCTAGTHQMRWTGSDLECEPITGTGVVESGEIDRDFDDQFVVRFTDPADELEFVFNGLVRATMSDTGSFSIVDQEPLAGYNAVSVLPNASVITSCGDGDLSDTLIELVDIAGAGTDVALCFNDQELPISLAANVVAESIDPTALADTEGPTAGHLVAVDSADATKFEYLVLGTGISSDGDTVSVDLGTSIETAEIGTDQVTPDKIMSTGKSDELCLTYEATGDTFAWQSCTGGGIALAGLDDVTLTTPATGAVLIKSAGDWIDGQLDLADADAVTGLLPDANIAATIARDSESAAAGDISGSLSAGFTIDSGVVDGTEIADDAVDTTELDDADTPTAGHLVALDNVSSTRFEYIAVGDGLNHDGDTLTATLGTSIVTGEITDGTILEEDLNATNTALDEEILTYESSNSGFEWHTAAELNLMTTGNDVVTPDNVLLAGQTDDYCLAYELTGDTWKWQDCSGATPTWAALASGDNANDLTVSGTFTPNGGTIEANAYTDPELTAIAGVSPVSPGFVAITGAGTASLREIKGDTGIKVSNGTGETTHPLIGLDYTLAIGDDPVLSQGECVFSAPSANGGILCEGSAAGGEALIEGLLRWNPTVTDKTITLPNATGTVALTIDTPAAGDITGSLSAGYNIGSNVVDGSHIATGAVGADELDAESVSTSELKDANTPVDEDIVTYEATGTQFEYHTPAELGLMETGNDVVSPDNVLAAGQTDEYCLTYEATGDTFAWQSCTGGGIALAGLDDVTLTTPATGATLIKSAGDWVDGQLDLADADAVTGLLPDANIAATIARDSESAAAGDISGSLSAGFTIDAGAVDGDELATDSVDTTELDDTDVSPVVGHLVALDNVSVTRFEYIAVGDGLTHDGDTLSADLGTTIVTGDITDDEILEADLDVTNTALDDEILTFDLGSGGFTWNTLSELGIMADTNDAVTPDNVLAAGQTDDYCLAYELTGDTWKWQDCSGVTPSLATLTDVTLTTPATGAVLIKSAGDWIDGQLNLADTDAVTGVLPDANVASTLSRDTESPGAGDITGSLSAGYDIGSNVVDGSHIGTGAVGADELDAEAVGSSELKDANTPVDEDIVTYEATGTQFEYHTPAELGLMTTGNDVVTPDNVLAAGKTDEYCLTYETTGDTWAWQDCSAVGAFDDLSDVTITTPATGATLIYNGAAWVDGQLDLADADAVTGVLPDANVAATIARDSESVAAGDISGSISGGLNIDNDSVTPDDVLLAGQTDDYCLAYETTGDTWKWQDCSGVTPSLATLTDVTLTTPATGAVLIKSAGDWIDGQLDLADTDAVTGVLPDANVATTLSRDTEAPAVGDITGSLAAGYTIAVDSVKPSQLDSSDTPSSGHLVAIPSDTATFNYISLSAELTNNLSQLSITPNGLTGSHINTNAISKDELNADAVGTSELKATGTPSEYDDVIVSTSDFRYRKNTVGTANPDPATDDDTLGYEIGSTITNTSTNEVWVALDVTDGAAVWKRDTDASGWSGVLDIDKSGANVCKDFATMIKPALEANDTTGVPTGQFFTYLVRGGDTATYDEADAYSTGTTAGGNHTRCMAVMPTVGFDGDDFPMSDGENACTSEDEPHGCCTGAGTGATNCELLNGVRIHIHFENAVLRFDPSTQTKTHAMLQFGAYYEMGGAGSLMGSGSGHISSGLSMSGRLELYSGTNNGGWIEGDLPAMPFNDAQNGSDTTVIGMFYSGGKNITAKDLFVETKFRNADYDDIGHLLHRSEGTTHPEMRHYGGAAGIIAYSNNQGTIGDGELTGGAYGFVAGDLVNGGDTVVSTTCEYSPCTKVSDDQGEANSLYFDNIQLEDSTFSQVVLIDASNISFLNHHIETKNDRKGPGTIIGAGYTTQPGGKTGAFPCGIDPLDATPDRVVEAGTCVRVADTQVLSITMGPGQAVNSRGNDSYGALELGPSCGAQNGSSAPRTGFIDYTRQHWTVNDVEHSLGPGSNYCGETGITCELFEAHDEAECWFEVGDGVNYSNFSGGDAEAKRMRYNVTGYDDPEVTAPRARPRGIIHGRTGIDNYAGSGSPTTAEGFLKGYMERSIYIDEAADPDAVWMNFDAAIGGARWIQLNTGGAGTFLPLTGGTLTGDLKIEGATPALEFNDTDAASDDPTTALYMECSGGAGVEDCDFEMWALDGGILGRQFFYDASADDITLYVSNLILGGGATISEGDMTIKQAATPAVILYDNDNTDDEQSGALLVDCTNNATTTEECDISLWGRKDGDPISRELLFAAATDSWDFETNDIINVGEISVDVVTVNDAEPTNPNAASIMKNVSTWAIDDTTLGSGHFWFVDLSGDELSLVNGGPSPNEYAELRTLYDNREDGTPWLGWRDTGMQASSAATITGKIHQQCTSTGDLDDEDCDLYFATLTDGAGADDAALDDYIHFDASRNLVKFLKETMVADAVPRLYFDAGDDGDNQGIIRAIDDGGTNNSQLSLWAQEGSVSPSEQLRYDGSDDAWRFYDNSLDLWQENALDTVDLTAARLLSTDCIDGAPTGTGGDDSCGFKLQANVGETLRDVIWFNAEEGELHLMSRAITANEKEGANVAGIVSINPTLTDTGHGAIKILNIEPVVETSTAAFFRDVYQGGSYTVDGLNAYGIMYGTDMRTKMYLDAETLALNNLYGAVFAPEVINLSGTNEMNDVFGGPDVVGFTSRPTMYADAGGGTLDAPESVAVLAEVYLKADTGETATITNAVQLLAESIGGRSAGCGAGTCTVTNAYGLRVEDPDNTGIDPTNEYGVWIDVDADGGTEFNIYALGTAPSVINTGLRIGDTTAPTEVLEVAGDGLITGAWELGDNPTLDTEGQLGWDPSTNGVMNGQLLAYDAAERVVPTVMQQCVTVTDLATGAANVPFWMNSAYAEVDILSGSCACIGVCTAEADITLEVDDGSVAAITGTLLCEAPGTPITTVTLSGAETQLHQFEVLRYDVSGTADPSGSDEYIICVNYEIERQ